MMRQITIMSAASHSCPGSVQPTRVSTEQNIMSMVFLRLTRNWCRELMVMVLYVYFVISNILCIFGLRSLGIN